jgi:hypothetical protein
MVIMVVPCAGEPAADVLPDEIKLALIPALYLSISRAGPQRAKGDAYTSEWTEASSSAYHMPASYSSDGQFCAPWSKRAISTRSPDRT